MDCRSSDAAPNGARALIEASVMLGKPTGRSLGEGVQLFLPSGEPRCRKNDGRPAPKLWQCACAAEKDRIMCEKHRTRPNTAKQARTYAGAPSSSHPRRSARLGDGHLHPTRHVRPTSNLVACRCSSPCSFQ